MKKSRLSREVKIVLFYWVGGYDRLNERLSLIVYPLKNSIDSERLSLKLD